MQLKIKNIGKIKEAHIEIQGITVIAGENNTGKSTVGKVLFALCSGLYNIDTRIMEAKKEAIREFIRAIDTQQFSFSDPIFFYFDIYNPKLMDPLFAVLTAPNQDKDKVIQQGAEMLWNDIPEKFKSGIQPDDVVPIVRSVYETANIPTENLFKEILQESFQNEFQGQINNIFSVETGSITLQLEQKQIQCDFLDNEIQFPGQINIFRFPTDVIYIDDPYILDDNPSGIDFLLFNSRPPNLDVLFNSLLPHKKHLLLQLLKKADRPLISRYKSKEKQKNVLEKINSIVSGSFIESSGMIEYQDRYSGKTLKVYNLSTGIKAFAFLKTIITNGYIEEKCTLILDEPEIHLHPEWQLIFAEILVLLQREYKLHILLTTHSPYFLNAIEVYSKKHKIDNKCKYYLAENDLNNMAEFTDVTDKLEALYRQLSKPFQKLENLEYGQT